MLIQTNAPIQHTGWTSLEKTIHDLDEAKMKDCKDDIDTLLIFVRRFYLVLHHILIQYM